MLKKSTASWLTIGKVSRRLGVVAKEVWEGVLGLLGSVFFFFDTSAESSKRGLVVSGYWAVS